MQGNGSFFILRWPSPQGMRSRIKMATLVPSINSCLGKMQAGEKRFARRLEALLEDDYLCWYELPVGKRQRYTDFIILHPGRGLLLLEVKDWKLDTIQDINRVSVSLVTNRGVVITSNPLEQARQCTYQLVNQLEKDPQLVRKSGQYMGRLSFPYGYGLTVLQLYRNRPHGSILFCGHCKLSIR